MWLSIHLTDLCNSKCDFCVVASPTFERNTVNYEQVHRFVMENASETICGVNLHGGEATIHPHFFLLVELIRTAGISEVHVQTNGTLSARQEFAQRMADSGITKAIISLHGAEPSVHDGQTKSPGSFSNVDVSIRNFKSLGIRVRTNTVLTLQNVNQLGQIVDFCKERQVDEINISNLHPVGSALYSRSLLCVPRDESVAVVRHVFEHFDDLRERISLEGFPECWLPELVSNFVETNPTPFRMLMRGQVIDDYFAFMKSQCRTTSACMDCNRAPSCGGIYPEYLEIFGTSKSVTPFR